MDKQGEIISELLRITKLINAGLIAKDIDIVLEMISEREILIDEYKLLTKRALTGSENEKVEKFMNLDKKNKILLEELMLKAKESVEEASFEKAKTQKRNKAAKRYLTDGRYLGNYSNFNKKT